MLLENQYDTQSLVWMKKNGRFNLRLSVVQNFFKLHAFVRLFIELKQQRFHGTVSNYMCYPVCFPLCLQYMLIVIFLENSKLCFEKSLFFLLRNLYDPCCKLGKKSESDIKLFKRAWSL